MAQARNPDVFIDLSFNQLQIPGSLAAGTARAPE
jgi:hypothetical protein